jgi:hypothetical protein
MISITKLGTKTHTRVYGLLLDYQPENKNRKSRKRNMGEVISPSYKILK